LSNKNLYAPYKNLWFVGHYFEIWSSLFFARPKYYWVNIIWFLMIDWNKNCLMKINSNKGVLSSPLSSSILIKGLSKKIFLISFN
jgi:hypothetical protein